MSDPEKLEQWQQTVVDNLGKFKGRGLVQITGRNVGKSFVSNAVALKRLLDDLQQRPIEALHCDVGTVFGKRFYTVEPDGGNWFDMEVWCTRTFGPAGDVHAMPVNIARWYMNDRRFWFLEQRDRDWFVIRWNS